MKFKDRETVELVLRRMKEIVHAKNNSVLARILEISPSAVHNMKMKRQIPDRHFMYISMNYNIPIERFLQDEKTKEKV